MQKQRHISALFLILVSVPLVFIALTEISKWQLKARMQRLLESGQPSVTLHIRADQVQWMDKKEILVEGCMFDIKASELKDGWYTFTGHFDKEETEFVNKQHNTRRTDSPAFNKLTQLFKTLQQQFHATEDGTREPGKHPLRFPPYQPGHVALICRSIPLPPPWS